MNLLDVNVWLASSWRNHESHDRVSAWIGEASDSLGLCRITQMGFLRLSTLPAIAGADTLTRRAAWLAFDQLRAQPNVVWLAEPDGLEDVWRAISAGEVQSHKLWTDDYLAAFAQTAGLTLVTLDRSCIKRYPSVRVEVI
jgi:toxin-antitoxin system PIN domain toxin